MSIDESIFLTVKQFIVERFGVQENSISEIMTFEDLGADSLDIVELVMELENEFNIQFTDDQITQIHTIKDVVKFIEISKK